MSRWFRAAEQTATELAQQNAQRQRPQVLSTTTFNIGLVDAQVRGDIVLPQAKMEFTISHFQNKDLDVGGDDLSLTPTFNQHLNDVNTRGTDSSILFRADNASPQAYALMGTYDSKGAQVHVIINLWQNGKKLHRYEMIGNRTKLEDLVAAIFEQAFAWIKTNTKL